VFPCASLFFSQPQSRARSVTADCLPRGVRPASRLDDASKCAQPALAKFYQSLNDEQKARIFASSWRLGDLIIGRGQHVADDLAIIRLVFHHQDALAHAASACRSTITGSVKVNVEPWPGRDSTQIRPPCISMMRFEIASPNPVPPFFLVMALSTC